MQETTVAEGDRIVMCLHEQRRLLCTEGAWHQDLQFPGLIVSSSGRHTIRKESAEVTFAYVPTATLSILLALCCKRAGHLSHEGLASWTRCNEVLVTSPRTTPNSRRLPTLGDFA